MDEESNESQGYLGSYGVVMVPAPDASGHWFVSLASWDDDAEAYVARTDGPLFDNRDEAMAGANKVLDWLATLPPDEDVSRIWEQMQQRIGAQEVLGREWPPRNQVWGIPPGS